MSQVLTFQTPRFVEFEHRFFTSFEESRFRVDENEGLPVFTFLMAGQEVLLPFAGIKREFDLPEYAADAVMLNTVAHALQYVGILRIGDAIPAELLSGEASWEPESRHVSAAHNRLGAQLVGWNLEQSVPLSDPVGLERFSDQFVTDATIRYALMRLEMEIAKDADDDVDVSSTMEDATTELSHIEALRERYLAVCDLGERLRTLRREFAHHANVMGELDPVTRLMSIPIKTLGLNLTEIDARVTNVVSLFRNFGFHRDAIREMRDDMSSRLGAWEDMTDAWSQVPRNISDPYMVTPLLRDLYRFLAPRYMPVDTWSLMLAKDGTLDEDRKYGEVVTWYDRAADVA